MLVFNLSMLVFTYVSQKTKPHGQYPCPLFKQWNKVEEKTVKLQQITPVQ